MAPEPVTRLPSAQPNRGGRPPTHGAYAKAPPPRIRERAQQITALLMGLPHTVAADQLAAEECGRLAALLEAIDDDIATKGAVTGRGHAPRKILDVRARYSRELRAWLEAFAARLLRGPTGRRLWPKEPVWPTRSHGAAGSRPMAELTAEPHRRRTDLAKRVDLARELLRPYAAASGSVEARLARRAWLALADIAAELVDDDD